jgi:hypothetical protein
MRSGLGAVLWQGLRVRRLLHPGMALAPRAVGRHWVNALSTGTVPAPVKSCGGGRHKTCGAVGEGAGQQLAAQLKLAQQLPGSQS